MHKYRIELVTTKDIMDFVNAVTGLNGSVKLVDESGFCVNGKDKEIVADQKGMEFSISFFCN